MRIGLLSDTHIPDVTRELPIAELRAAFRGVQLILHGGDIYFTKVLDDLETIAPVVAALGDDDSVTTMQRDQRIQSKHVITVDGHRLWLIHERPYNLAAAPFPWMPDPVPDRPEIVVFGHQHKTVLEKQGGILFISPGSPTFLNYQHGLGTVGILDIEDGRVEAKLIHL